MIQWPTCGGDRGEPMDRCEMRRREIMHKLDLLKIEVEKIRAEMLNCPVEKVAQNLRDLAASIEEVAANSFLNPPKTDKFKNDLDSLARQIKGR